MQYLLYNSNIHHCDYLIHLSSYRNQGFKTIRNKNFSNTLRRFLQILIHNFANPIEPQCLRLRTRVTFCHPFPRAKKTVKMWTTLTNIAHNAYKILSLLPFHFIDKFDLLIILKVPQCQFFLTCQLFGSSRRNLKLQLLNLTRVRAEARSKTLLPKAISNLSKFS